MWTVCVHAGWGQEGEEEEEEEEGAVGAARVHEDRQVRGVRVVLLVRRPRHVRLARPRASSDPAAQRYAGLLVLGYFQVRFSEY